MPGLADRVRRVWGDGAGFAGRPDQDNKPRYALPQFWKSNQEVQGKILRRAPRLSNSLPQREGARLPPGSRRASRLLFQGFHPVPGALGGAGSPAPRLRAERARQLFGGFSGTATRRPTGRVRWVMWRRCRTCPVRDSGDSSRASRHRPRPTLPETAQTPRRRLLGVGNSMCCRRCSTRERPADA
jgi:hypothetical protein